jgi:hypothetical protein
MPDACLLSRSLAKHWPSGARHGLKHLAAGQPIGEVPAYRHDDHVPWPAIAAEGGQRVLGEGAPTRPASILLTTITIEAVAF